MRRYQQGLKHKLGTQIGLCYAPCSPSGYTEPRAACFPSLTTYSSL